MKYYVLEPEVAGELGEETVLDPSTHPPRVDKLHYRFNGWLGDSILESFPCFIATDTASAALKEAGITGVNFGTVCTSTSAEFNEMYPGRILPKFSWVKVHGKAGEHDLGIAVDHRLVISERALAILRPFGISHALIEEFRGNVATN